MLAVCSPFSPRAISFRDVGASFIPRGYGPTLGMRAEPRQGTGFRSTAPWTAGPLHSGVHICGRWDVWKEVRRGFAGMFGKK